MRPAVRTRFLKTNRRHHINILMPMGFDARLSKGSPIKVRWSLDALLCNGSLRRKRHTQPIHVLPVSPLPHLGRALKRKVGHPRGKCLSQNGSGSEQEWVPDCMHARRAQGPMYNEQPSTKLTEQIATAPLPLQCRRRDAHVSPNSHTTFRH